MPVDRAALGANAAVLWGMMAAVVLIPVAAAGCAGLSIDLSPKLQVNLCVCLILALSGCFFTFRNFCPRLALIASSFAQLIAATIALCLLTYSLTALASTTPLRDGALAAIDADLGFRWLDLLRWGDAHPAVTDLAGVAYGSIHQQAVLAVLVLGLRRDHRALQEAVYGYVLALSATAILAYFVPAVGAFAYFDVRPAMHGHVALTVADIPVADILGLRSHALTSFELERAKGIISFPSFHAALGVLFIRCFWSVPSLRWPGAVFNATMIAATPLHGSHYLTDVLLGLSIGAASAASAARLHAGVAALWGRPSPVRAGAGRSDVRTVPVPNAENLGVGSA